MAEKPEFTYTAEDFDGDPTYHPPAETEASWEDSGGYAEWLQRLREAAEKARAS